MYQNVFQCEGCGNLYQSKVAPMAPWHMNTPPSGATAHGGYTRVPGLGNSDVWHMNLQGDGTGIDAINKLLCFDCAVCVANAIEKALATR